MVAMMMMKSREGDDEERQVNLLRSVLVFFYLIQLYMIHQSFLIKRAKRVHG